MSPILYEGTYLVDLKALHETMLVEDMLSAETLNIFPVHSCSVLHTERSNCLQIHYFQHTLAEKLPHKNKRELLLVVVGGIFVLETLSVMIQVLSVRYRGKRVFKMAPIHHHFELLGWPENRVVVRFWILAILLALVTLSTVKLQ